jgi:inhibitor of cysteine peptidase
MKNMKSQISQKLSLCLIMLAAVMAACTPVTTPNMPVDSGGQATQTGPKGENLVIRENAEVQEIHINFMESFPLQVSVTINGMLPDGCTSIHGTQVLRDLETGNFNINILTERPEDAICTQVLTPFEITVPLDVLGLPEGTYMVNVYGHYAGFTFDKDNVLPD